MAFQFVGTLMRAIHVPARVSKKGEAIEEVHRLQLGYEHTYVEGADPELKTITLKVTKEAYEACKGRQNVDVVVPIEVMVGDKGNLIHFYPKGAALPRFLKSAAVSTEK